MHLQKKVNDILVPAGMSLTKLSLAAPGIIKLFPARESLASDILAGDRKMANLFYSVYYQVIENLSHGRPEFESRRYIHFWGDER
jgi:hypothetical protein